jgi:RimJ/RimL family protein N-acetyltransferase
MILRPANLDDENRLLIWRNDPVTRQASLSQHVIGKKEHARWLRKSLSDPARKIFVAEKDGIPIGTFRIDSQEELLFLSWTIAPSWRHRGLGREMVESARIDDHKALKAVIRKNNIPSTKLALHLGLSLQSEEEDLLFYFKE